MKPIGVFDSGVGGEWIAQRLGTAFPNRQILLEQDKEHLPYGTKSAEELLDLVVPKLQKLADQDCEAIVVACNTVTTNVIEELRPKFSVPLIGMEPMVKPAADITASNIIAICATPATLKSARYAWLKNTYAHGIKVLEPDCSQWASLIEAKQMNRDSIDEMVDEVCNQGADVIVLGCTHYHWIEQEILEAVQGRAQVLQPELPVIAQLDRMIGPVTP